MAFIESTLLTKNNWQPKQNHRFILSAPNTTIPAFLVTAATKPNISINPVTVDYINKKYKYSGKAEWMDIDLTLYDPIVPSGAQAVMEWIRLAHESLTGRDGYSDFYKKDLFLQTLGPVGDIVEEWKIVGAFINNATFGDLDWSDDEVTKITITLSYDYAVLQF